MFVRSVKWSDDTLISANPGSVMIALRVSDLHTAVHRRYSKEANEYAVISCLLHCP